MAEHLSVPQLRRATQQAQEWINDLRGHEYVEDDEQAYSHLRAVLHALRDSLTVNEAVHLGQQLPMLARGFYYDGWKPATVPREIETVEDFLEHVRETLGGPVPAAGEPDPRAGIRAVLDVLDARLPEGTLEHVKQQLTEEVRELFPEPGPEELT